MPNHPIAPTVPEALDALSDAELVALTLPLASNVGCVLWLAALSVPALLAMVFGLRHGALAGLVGIALAYAIHRVLDAMPTRRRALRAAAAFDRRFGEPALQEAEREAAARLTRDGATEAVVLLHGCGLPHGGLDLTHITIGTDASLSHRHSPLLGDLHSGKRLHEITRGERALAEHERAPLMSLLGKITDLLPPPESELVHDGYPCTLVILRRDIPALRLAMNAAGIVDQQHPVAQLLAYVFKLTGR